MPSLKSFRCTVDEESSRHLEKQIKGKWQLEKAFNKDKLYMPHDTIGLRMLYGKDEKRKQAAQEMQSTMTLLET